MNQFDGGVTVDEGYRAATPGGSASSSTTRVEERAAVAGEWSDDLGHWGEAEWELPGFGEKGPRCGEYYPESVCDSCGTPQFATHQCGRRGCPDCWGTWAKEASVRATVRTQAFRYTLPDNYERQAAHAVVSVPEGEVMNERQFYEGRKKAAEIAEEKGFRGFAVVPHPYRMTDDAKRQYRSDNVDYGIWAWWRRDRDGDRDLIKWSPHYHIIGVTTQDMDSGDDSDDWVYTFLRSFGRFTGTRDTDSHEEVYGAFRYLMSHTGWPEGSDRDAVTWYGDLANSIFVENATQDWQHQKPSEGVLSALEREIEEIAGVGPDDDESDESGGQSDDTDDMGECPCDDCDGLLIDVFDVRRYLDYNDPPPDVASRMIAAYEWRMGERTPPPGLMGPKTEEQAREAFEALL